MKKIVLLMLVLFLAVPAISYAGSATSRWDLTIGGNVQADFGWADRSTTILQRGAIPQSRDTLSGNSTDVTSRYGNTLWGSGSTGLNFAVRGPDAWGAKTSAFVSGDFVGTWGGSAYNTFDLLSAWMAFDWANDNLQIGEFGGSFGIYGTFAAYQVGWGSFPFGGKGPAPVNPAIRWTHRFDKNWSASLAIQDQNDGVSGTNSNAPAGTTALLAPLATNTGGAVLGPNTYTRSPVPDFVGNLAWTSDSCGKIGPWQLSFATSGVYGQEKRIYQDTSGGLHDKQVDTWYADFKAMVPIIPEHNGDKRGALLVDGIAYMAQNFDAYYGGWGSVSPNSYARAATISATGNVSGNSVTFAAPVSSGFDVHAVYYFVDQVWLSGFYTHAKNDISQPFAVANPNAGKNMTQYIATLGYEPNAALKFVAQWDYTFEKFATFGSAAGFHNYGTRNDYSITCIYYF